MPDHTAPDATPTGRLSRRSLLAASAGAAAAIGAAGLPVLATGTPPRRPPPPAPPGPPPATAAAALPAPPPAPPALAKPKSKLRVEPLIPAKNRGIILYSVRDRITAAPDDSGVPYGFERVLAR